MFRRKAFAVNVLVGLWFFDKAGTPHQGTYTPKTGTGAGGILYTQTKEQKELTENSLMLNALLLLKEQKRKKQT